MKRTLILLPFLLNANLLSTLKQKELNYNEQINKQDFRVNNKSWLNPLNLKYSINQDNLQGIVKKTKTFTISINQPIFKSGAIYYSLKYSKNLKKLNSFQNEKLKMDLIQKAYDLAIDYKKTLLNKKILELQIENGEIDVSRKREEYLNGTIDSSFLDNAILSLNNLKLNLTDLENSLQTIKLNFANISTLKIENIKLPKIELISKDEYIQKNIETKISKENIKVNKNLYKMTKGDNLLTISLNANYNIQNVEYPNRENSLKFYNLGITFSMPIFFNSINKIEKSKLNYLKSRLLLEDKKRTLENEYKLALFKLKSISPKEKIYQKNVDIYENLINSTLENIKAGNKTTLDLEVLQNSLQIMKLNLKMLQLEKRKIVLDLYCNIQ